MKMIIAIALGGSLGAVARHFFARWVMVTYGGQFPLGIMAANILGSFLMGGMVALVGSHFTITQEMRAFLMVGFLGAFTTFSTFALEAVMLGQKDAWISSMSYIVLSVGMSMIALLAGMRLGRMILQ